MRPDEDIAGCEAAHRRLSTTLDEVAGDTVGAPSLLPGWNVAMVLTHLARNADSFVRMVEGALEGEVRDQYVGGVEGRAAAIEAGRDRDRDAVVDDLRTAYGALEASWRRLDDEQWRTGRGRLSSGTVCTIDQLPFCRWREVEVHHRDLGLGYSELDWPEAYVAVELRGALAGVPDRLELADRRRWLAWLLGRTGAPAPDGLGPWLPRPTATRDPNC